MNAVRRYLYRAARRKRAQVLVLIGLVFVLTGIIQQDTDDAIRNATVAQKMFVAHTQIMSLDAWGFTFVGAGLLAIVAAVWAAGRLEWLAFVALQSVAIFWGCLYVDSWYLTGYTRALVVALTWAALSGVLLIVAGWDDPPPKSDPPR